MSWLRHIYIVMETTEKEGAPLQSKHIYRGINAKHISATSFIYSINWWMNEYSYISHIYTYIYICMGWRKPLHSLSLPISHLNNLLCCITLLMRGSAVVFDRYYYLISGRHMIIIKPRSIMSLLIRRKLHTTIWNLVCHIHQCEWKKIRWQYSVQKYTTLLYFN